MNNQTIDGVPRDYVLRLTPEAHSVLLGMVEHCLNIRACMGMDEGFKDFDTEEEHDFVKELRALLDAPVCHVCGDTGSVKLSCAPWTEKCTDCKESSQPQGEPVAWLIQWESVIPGFAGHREVVLVKPEIRLDSATVTPLFAKEV